MPTLSTQPLTQKQLLSMLARGQSLDGIEIGDLDFSGYCFKRHLDFSGAVFKGKTQFRRAQFLDGANFSRAVFLNDGGCRFGGSRFTGAKGADFRNAEFSGYAGADFSRSHFSCAGGVDFSNTHFSVNGSISFGQSQFSGPGAVSFRKAVFSGAGGVDFFRALFAAEGGVDFTGAKFHGGGEYYLDGKTFKWRDETCRIRCLDFSRARFQGRGPVTFHRSHFRHNHLSGFDHVEAEHPENIHFHHVYLGSTSFYQTHIEKFSFKHVTFKTYRGWLLHRRLLMDEFLESHYIELEGRFFDRMRTRDKHKVYFQHIETLYRRLKENFEAALDFSGAADFHYGEMDMKLKGKPLLLQIVSPLQFLRWLTGYGEKWHLALIWFFVFLMIFTQTNLNWIEPRHTIDPSIPENQVSACSNTLERCPEVGYRDSLFFSFNAMTLRKDPWFQQKSLDSYRGTFQGLLGATLLGLMLFGLRRQFRK